MSVIAETATNSAASETAATTGEQQPIATPVAPDVPATAVTEPAETTEPANAYDEIQRLNAERQAELDAEGTDDEPDEPAADAIAEPVEDEAQTAEDQPAETAVAFTPDEPYDAFIEKRDAYLAGVEITPELQAILDRQEAELTSVRSVVNELDGIANKDTILDFGSAVNQVIASATVDQAGRVNYDGTPIAEVLRKQVPDEFRSIAEAFFRADSQNIEGASVFEELLIDYFGEEKAKRMYAYGTADTPLPVVAQVALPAGLDDANREAYMRLPEQKRFQIESLVAEVLDMQTELNDADLPSYRKAELTEDLRDKKTLLDSEFFAVRTMQKDLEGDRQRATTTQRQQEEARITFRNQVATVYNEELFAMADTFASDLAPRLTYADGDTQLAQARNILSRINNALAFDANDPAMPDDPMALHYAKQLTEEGVKFDFSKGRNLLKAHFKATEKLEALKARRASPQHIDIATREKNKLLFDIKTEQKQLLGQLSAKYVTSNGSAISKQVGELQKKKQAVRSITPGGKASQQSKPLSGKDQIEAWNRKVAAANPDEMFSQYQ